MANKRIVFVLPSLGKGGAQRATVSLVNFLSETSGFDITLIALKSDEVEFTLRQEVKVVKLASNSFKASLGKFVTILKSERPEIVYSALWHVNLLVILSRLILMLSGAPRFYHIASVHNNPARIIQTENKVLSIVYYYFLARFSTKIVAVSKGIKEHLNNKCLIPTKKVVLAYNPAITDKHRAQITAAIDNDFALRHEGRYLVWVGRLDYQKDPLKFLEIAKLCHLPAIIIGDGPLEEEVKNYISKNNLGENVLWLPFQENVMALMAKAYLLVMTSRFEGFGLVLVEALVAGTPVISTNCLYGPSEIIIEGDNGLLLEDGASANRFADVICALRRNESLYRKMCEQAPSSVEKFSDKVVFEQYRELFR